MTLGQIVDYVLDWNDMHDEEKAEKKEKKRQTREATQTDWDAFWD